MHVSHEPFQEFRSSAGGGTFYTDQGDRGAFSCQNFKPIFVILKNMFHVTHSLQLLLFSSPLPPCIRIFFPRTLAVSDLGEQ